MKERFQSSCIWKREFGKTKRRNVSPAIEISSSPLDDESTEMNVSSSAESEDDTADDTSEMQKLAS